MIVKKIAIDLGTCNCIVFVPRKGIVLQDPSVVAVSKPENKIFKIVETFIGVSQITSGDICFIGIPVTFCRIKIVFDEIKRKPCKYDDGSRYSYNCKPGSIFRADFWTPLIIFNKTVFSVDIAKDQNKDTI